MEPDPQSHEQTVTMFEEPGNAFLEPVPPLVPDRMIRHYTVTSSEGATDEPAAPTDTPG